MNRILKVLFMVFSDGSMSVYLIGPPFISESLTEVTSLCITMERCNAFIFYFILMFSYKFSACAISIDVVNAQNLAVSYFYASLSFTATLV